MDSSHLLIVKEWHWTAFAIFLIFFVNIVKHTDPRSMIHVNSVRWLQKDRKVNFQLCFYCTLIYSLSYCTLYNAGYRCGPFVCGAAHASLADSLPSLYSVFCFGDLLGFKLFFTNHVKFCIFFLPVWLKVYLQCTYPCYSNLFCIFVIL